MSKWHEKDCGCGGTVVYHEDWDRIPDICKDCIAEKRAAREKWHEKDCSCGQTIRYHEDWERIPDLCRGCIQEKRTARAKWHEATCGCGKSFTYHEDWSNKPTHCENCRRWLEKTCAAQGCSETIRYRTFWERVPDYCKSCKNGDKRINVRQRKDNGTVHEYEGRGYVNRQGVAVFRDNAGSGRHGHAVYNADGSLKGRREEGWGEGWANEPINVTTSGANAKERAQGTAKHNRFSTAYKDRRRKDDPPNHQTRHHHEYAKYEQGRYSEGSAGENFERNGRRR